MAYGDRVDPKQRAASIFLTAVLGIGTAVMMWLAFNPEYAKKLITITEAKEIIEEKEVVEPPPPPPEPEQEVSPPIDAPPSPSPPRNAPVVVPPTKVDAPTIVVPVVKKIEAPAAPPPPPPPPPPIPEVDKSKKASPQGNPGRWASSDDYPSRSLREENEGVTRFSVQIGTNGRVTSCSVTGSSGHADLDAATCKLVSSRAKFSPALGKDGSPTTGSYSSSVRWQIPKE